MDKFAVGQKVWISGDVRHDKEGIYETTVSKIGRKYVYTGEEYRSKKFDAKTLREVSVYTSYRRLYLSKRDYYDDLERDANWKKLRNYFGEWAPKLSLGATRQILGIIRGEELK